MKKIDIFPHIFPRAYFDKMVEVIPNKNAVRRWLNIPVLYDLDSRLRMMEEFGQRPVPPIPSPPVDVAAGRASRAATRASRRDGVGAAFPLR